MRKVAEQCVYIFLESFDRREIGGESVPDAEAGDYLLPLFIVCQVPDHDSVFVP